VLPLAIVLLKERVSMRSVIGTALSIGGVGVLFYG